MTIDELRNEFKVETRRDAVIINQYTYPTEQYFNWLEERLVKLLTTPQVSKREGIEREDSVCSNCGGDKFVYRGIMLDNKVPCPECKQTDC